MARGTDKIIIRRPLPQDIMSQPHPELDIYTQRTTMNPISVHRSRTHAIIFVILLTLFIAYISPTFLSQFIPSFLPAFPSKIAQASTPTVDILGQKNTQINIIGGKETEAGAYPWMVGLIENDKEDVFWAQYCGGTLVHPQWVLTAAHCTYSYGREMAVDEIDILAGQDELRATTGERIPVIQIIRHPEYKKNIGDADLALIKLAVPSAQPSVKLADFSMANIDNSGAIGTVLGWGRTTTNIRINHLQQVNVPLVLAETCTTAYTKLGYTMTENMLCAGYPQGGKDACSGDSGGPLVIHEIEGDESSRWVQAGIVSWGKGCAQADAYGVYTHVARFKDWVDLQIALNTFTNNSGSAIIPPSGQGQTATSIQIFMPIINH